MTIAPFLLVIKSCLTANIILGVSTTVIISLLLLVCSKRNKRTQNSMYRISPKIETVAEPQPADVAFPAITITNSTENLDGQHPIESETSKSNPSGDKTHVETNRTVSMTAPQQHDITHISQQTTAEKIEHAPNETQAVTSVSRPEEDGKERPLHTTEKVDTAPSNLAQGMLLAGMAVGAAYKGYKIGKAAESAYKEIETGRSVQREEYEIEEGEVEEEWQPQAYEDDWEQQDYSWQDGSEQWRHEEYDNLPYSQSENDPQLYTGYAAPVTASNYRRQPFAVLPAASRLLRQSSAPSRLARQALSPHPLQRRSRPYPHPQYTRPQTRSPDPQYTRPQTRSPDPQYTRPQMRSPDPQYTRPQTRSPDPQYTRPQTRSPDPQYTRPQTRSPDPQYTRPQRHRNAPYPHPSSIHRSKKPSSAPDTPRRHRTAPTPSHHQGRPSSTLPPTHARAPTLHPHHQGWPSFPPALPPRNRKAPPPHQQQGKRNSALPSRGRARAFSAPPPQQIRNSVPRPSIPSTRKKPKRATLHTRPKFRPKTKRRPPRHPHQGRPSSGAIPEGQN